MAKIKTPPVFEKRGMEWKLKKDDCPIYDGYLTVFGQNNEGSIVNYAACVNNCCVVSWYPYCAQPEWRVLQ